MMINLEKVWLSISMYFHQLNSFDMAQWLMMQEDKNILSISASYVDTGFTKRK